MSYVSEKEAALKNAVLPQTKKDDFESFWNDAVKQLRTVPIKIERKQLDLPYAHAFTTYEIRFNTHDDTVVDAYYLVPTVKKSEKLPCVAVFHGGGGCRDIFAEIAATGVCCFAIDVRSQGGTTFDKASYRMGDDFRGALMTHDLLYKDSYYMKNIYLDAIRTIDVIAQLDEVDPEKIVAYGQSQGGALSIVAAALSGKVKKAYPCVPSYACLQQRVEAGSGVFGAVKEYLIRHPEHTDIAMDTLSYFDINNMVSLLKVPTDFFLGLIDPVCLPPFVYSPYTHTTAAKTITFGAFTPHTISKEYKLTLYRAFASL